MLNNNCISTILTDAKMKLKNANISTYSLDAELLLSTAAKLTKVQLYTCSDKVLTPSELEMFNNFLIRRLNNEPIAYILEKCEFMGLDFKVNSSVLIPRGDTEVLIEEIIKVKQENMKILDIGTGSGAIAISLAKFIPNAKITAIDISEKALEIAKENARLNKQENQIKFIKSNLFESVNERDYDIIVSNPPYIKKEVIPTLDINVKNFEPLTALDGGDDGLFFYKEITKSSSNYLKQNGRIFYEIGYDQGKDVNDILLKNSFYNVRTILDLAGLDRVVTGIYRRS